jgi:hypothetical protein
MNVFVSCGGGGRAYIGGKAVEKYFRVYIYYLNKSWTPRHLMSNEDLKRKPVKGSEKDTKENKEVNRVALDLELQVK